MDKGKILVVEDDRAVGNLIMTALQTGEYECRLAGTGGEAILEAAAYNPDVIILDLGLPDMDGIQVIDKVRGWSEMPIVIVSARGDDTDKVAGLDAGADDYLTKPFSVEELLARIRVALRRRRSESTDPMEQAGVYRNGDMAIHYLSGRVFLKGQEIHLTPMEYRLLCLLAQNTGRVLTHNYLLREAWGDSQSGDTPALRVYMATLRKKIERVPSQPKYIQTHVGIGYRMIRQEVSPGASERT